MPVVARTIGQLLQRLLATEVGTIPSWPAHATATPTHVD
jgi:hypothetical protein